MDDDEKRYQELREEENRRYEKAIEEQYQKFKVKPWWQEPVALQLIILFLVGVLISVTCSGK